MNSIKKIGNIPNIVSDIPSLPVIASRILHIIADDTSSLEELKKVISLDQSFSSRLLRIANSPYYRRGRSINDITDATMLIGFNTIKALVFAASLKDLCRISDATDRLLWEHSMAVSIGATVIANETALFASGEPLIYGLLYGGSLSQMRGWQVNSRDSPHILRQSSDQNQEPFVQPL